MNIRTLLLSILLAVSSSVSAGDTDDTYDADIFTIDSEVTNELDDTIERLDYIDVSEFDENATGAELIEAGFIEFIEAIAIQRMK